MNDARDTPDLQDDGGSADIAIVGMAGRFPGAPSVDALWDKLRQGESAAVAFSDDELRAKGVPDASLNDPAYVKSGMVLEGVDQFDAAFFGYAPREAARLDPQHRLFLEVAWEALEHAGCAPGDAGGPQLTGVVAGTGANSYLLMNLLPHENLTDARDISALQGLMNGNDKDALSTRVAYKLDLRGPAVTVQTACSTSLVAVHLACRSLLNHEVDVSLAGGVWLNLLQSGGYLHQEGSILSPDGVCRAFDERAQGTVIGSGAGAVVLKRLADALADGDTVHAVIKGSAINNDGSSKIGYAAPSVEGQVEVILAAQAVAGVSPDSIGYVEAHGTGTTLGDPVEVEALTRAFRTGTDRRGYCALGSVKTNVGHLDAAAGVTGLIKAVLALRHRQLPPSLNFERPNPRIDFAASPFHVNTALLPWPQGDTPRRAAVSSFGMGGTNAHLILEEAPVQATPQRASRGWQVLPVSARSPAALDEAVSRLQSHLQSHPEQPLPDVAWTLQTGRKAFAQRAALVCDARSGHAWRVPASQAGPAAQAGAGVVFLFPGQGAQHPGMAARLYQDEPVFRAEVDRCLAVLGPLLGVDLVSLLTHADLADDAVAAERLSQTALTQPALFVVEHALARLWMSWGVQPEGMLGHSIGEYVAACLAGVWTLDEALKLVVARGRLLQALPVGAMLAVGLSEAELAPHLIAGCDIAAVNGPQACVLSGPVEVIDALERGLSHRGVAVRRLRVSHAFHSSMLEPMLGDFRTELDRVTLRPPRLPFVSNVTGGWITPEQATDPAYWVAHLRGTVRFNDGLSTVLAQPGRVLLEVGPGETLGTLARRHPAVAGTVVLPSLPHPGRPAERDPWPVSLARLWQAGVAIDWACLHEAGPPQRVPLPSYPFERQRCWIDAPTLSRGAHAAASGGGATDEAPLAGRPVDSWFFAPAWRRTDAPADPWRHAGRDEAWLVFGDAQGLGGALRSRLRERGQRVALVELAASAAASSVLRIGDEPDGVRLMPDDAAGHERLVDWLRAQAPRVVRVLHAWSVDAGDKRSTDDLIARGFGSLQRLTQALRTAPLSRVHVTVVADRLHDVTGGDAVDLAKAALLGPSLALPQEVPGATCQVIDLPVLAGVVAWGALADRLIADAVQDRPAKDNVIAYRGPHRWVRGFEPVQRPVASGSPWRQGGVHVITGGLGGIGLTLAHHLARTTRARLALLSRSATLVPREQWPALLADPAGREAEAATVRAVKALEDDGAEVMVLRADASDAASLRDALALVKRRFGALHGVVHAAGDAGAGAASASAADSASADADHRVLLPKLHGALALQEALRDTPLELLVLCSSLASVTGDLGQAAYGGANACLDAAAQAWQQLAGGPAARVVSIGWDGWRDVGMAADMAWPDGVGIAPAQGVEVLDRILAGPPLAQVLVSTVDLAQRLGGQSQDWLLSLAASGAAVSPGAAMGGCQPRPALSTPFEAPAEELDIRLAGIWQGLLGIDPIGLEDSFFELGGDSLLAIQMLARVKAAFGVAVQTAEFFKDPTVAALAMRVETRLIDDIEHA